MDLSLSQRILVVLVQFLIRVLYLLDEATGEGYERFVEAIKIPVLSGAYVFMLGFLMYSMKTGFVHRSLDYAVNPYFPVTVQAPYTNKKDVLGVKASGIEIPVKVNDINFPQITARAVLIVDKTSEKVLYEQNSTERLASASTTKLMTALVALDIYKPDDTFTVSEECYLVDSTKAWLPVGTKYSTLDLLNAMLISSAGDAACVLGSGQESLSEFIYLMNKKAIQLGMKSTFFTNPIGLDGQGNSHFSTAYDLYRLEKAAMANKDVASIVKKKEYTVKSLDESYIGKLETTNKLLFEIPQTVGVKTGKTAEAGEVLIYEYLDGAKNIVIIVMGSQDRFSDTRTLLNWVLASYNWK